MVINIFHGLNSTHYATLTGKEVQLSPKRQVMKVMNLDGEKEVQEKPGIHKRAVTESESELFMHSKDSENSDDESDIGGLGLGDEIDDITEEVESDDE